MHEQPYTVMRNTVRGRTTHVIQFYVNFDRYEIQVVERPGNVPEDIRMEPSYTLTAHNQRELLDKLYLTIGQYHFNNPALTIRRE